MIARHITRATWCRIFDLLTVVLQCPKVDVTVLLVGLYVCVYIASICVGLAVARGAPTSAPCMQRAGSLLLTAIYIIVGLADGKACRGTRGSLVVDPRVGRTELRSSCGVQCKLKSIKGADNTFHLKQLYNTLRRLGS